MRLTFCRLLAAALIAATPAPAVRGAAPTPAAPAKGAAPMDTARKALDEVQDMSYQNKSLNEIISDLRDKAKVSVTIDPGVFQFGLDPSQPTVNVDLKQVKLKDGLRQALAPFNLKCGLTRDGLFISTEEGLTARQLRQRVTVNCDGTAFATAAKQLAIDTGANVVLDPRLGDKGTKAVTLSLEDVPLETAVRLLAEVADLTAVRMSNVLFVTTPERAERLKPGADGPTQPGNNVVPFPGNIPGGPGGPGGIIGGLVPIGGAPGVILPAPVPAAEAKPDVKPEAAPPAKPDPAKPEPAKPEPTKPSGP